MFTMKDIYNNTFYGIREFIFDTQKKDKIRFIILIFGQQKDYISYKNQIKTDFEENI